MKQIDFASWCKMDGFVDVIYQIFSSYDYLQNIRGRRDIRINYIMWYIIDRSLSPASFLGKGKRTYDAKKKRKKKKKGKNLFSG